MSLENLPPEMQARIAAIMQGQPAETAAPAPAHAPAPIAKPPSLMDNVIALRQEVAQLSQQVAAQGQVTEAVGNAVGAIYEMFSPTQQQGYSYEATGEEYTDQADY